MRRHFPPWLRALTAEPGSREADFDWGEWSADVWRSMRAHWMPYLVLMSVFMSMFSCADRQFEREIAANDAVTAAKKHDPWALDKPAEIKP